MTRNDEQYVHLLAQLVLVFCNGNVNSNGCETERKGVELLRWSECDKLFNSEEELKKVAKANYDILKI